MLGEWQRAWPYLAYGVGMLGLSGVLVMIWSRLYAVQRECERERRGREEMEAYMRLDLRLDRDGDLREVGGRICGAIASRSVFRRVALLAREAEGDLHVFASVGVDEVSSLALEAWARSLPDREHFGEPGWGAGVRIGEGSFVMTLRDAAGEDAGRVVVVPLHGSGESTMGALVVFADSIFQVQRRRAEEAVASLEALAVKMARAIESAESVRLTRRVERLAAN
jgi:hypothetical protein